MANDSMVEAFISIHHNSPLTGDTNPNPWYTVALYSSWPTVEGDPSNRPRDTTRLLAKKVAMKVSEYFGSLLQSRSPWDALNAITVLSRTSMPSAVSEASFISVDDEATLFAIPSWAHPDWSDHAEVEARGINQGYISWYLNNGIGQVDYAYVLSSWTTAQCTVNIDWQSHEVPFEWCWPINQYYTISADWDFYFEGYHYTFYRWARVDYKYRDILELYSPGTNPLYAQPPVTDLWGYISLIALYTGGDFGLDW